MVAYGRYTYEDLKTKVQLKSGETLSHSMQFYESLALVVNAALGGKPKEADASKAPKNLAEMNAKLNRILG